MEDIKECVRLTVEKFGRIDILVNNASALWWQRIENTPTNKYDLIMELNARGSFAMTSLCLPIMAKGGFGRVICMSPPIKTDFESYAGFTAYYMSKFGMTMVAMGAAAEYKGKGITGHSLWPATVIESQACAGLQGWTCGLSTEARSMELIHGRPEAMASSPRAFRSIGEVPGTMVERSPHFCRHHQTWLT